VSEETGGGPSAFALGTVVAGYRLEEQIGRGGMAVVYRAHDSRLDRYVALKILAPGLAADAAFRKRFIQESKAAAAADDPHIIPVYEAGEANGVLFIAMRFVRGGDVRSLLERDGVLSPAAATEIISQAASALDAAHTLGLVHRDVKPANMLLEPSPDPDRPDHVYLADFGLTKAALGQSAAGLTATGQFLGTLDYVAPEQIEGRPVDGRTDLYALACAAFELLTGAPPFRRPDAMAVMYAQVSAEPPLLSSRRQGLPPAADSVMNRALAKAPADRYPSCREFAAALRRAFGLHSDSGPMGQPPGRPPTELAAQIRQAAVPGTRQAPPDQLASASAAPPTQPVSYPPPVKPALADQSSGPPGQTDQVISLPDGYVPGGRRPRVWYRSPAPLAAICAAVVVIGGGGFFLVDHGNSGSTGHNGHNGGDGVAAPSAVKTFRCNQATPSSLTTLSLPARKNGAGNGPFAVQVSPDRNFTFVSENGGIEVRRNHPGSQVPTLLDTIPAPGINKGLATTSDGKLLVAADNDGAVVINVSSAESGQGASAVLGTFTDQSLGGHNGGGVGVQVTPDDKFVFVTMENSSHMAVFNLAKAVAQGNFSAPGVFVGGVPLDPSPVGISQVDGDVVYVTTFQKQGAAGGPSVGTLNVVDWQKAETQPSRAVLHTVDAGCSPARIVISGQGSGKTLWVTARDSNTLLAVSAAKLVKGNPHPVLAELPVGPAPVGLTLVKHDTRLIVADTNQHSDTSNGFFAVVNISKMLSNQPGALIGKIPAAGQPRQLANRKGTVVATDEASGNSDKLPGSVQVIVLAGLS
jgi:serine/threonine protein kinase